MTDKPKKKHGMWRFGQGKATIGSNPSGSFYEIPCGATGTTFDDVEWWEKTSEIACENCLGAIEAYRTQRKA